MAALPAEAAKSEVQRQVTEFIVEPLCALFDELYATSQDQDGRLLTFQMQLRAIPKWSAVTVAKWVDKVLAACNCFEELVTALFLSHIKLLSSIRLGQATLKVKIPRNEKFIHAVMILAAKGFYEDPMIFRHKNAAAKARVLSHALNKTVRDMLPLKELLQEYLAQRPPMGNLQDPEPSAPDIAVQPASEEPAPPAPSLELAELANEETVQRPSLTEEPLAAVAPPREEEPFVEEIKSIELTVDGAHTALEAEEPVEEAAPSKQATAAPPQPTDEVLLDDILVNHPSATATLSTRPAHDFFSDAEV